MTFYASRSLRKREVGCRDMWIAKGEFCCALLLQEQKRRNHRGVFQRERANCQASSKDEGGCLLRHLWFLFICCYPPPQGGLSAYHNTCLTRSAEADGQLTQLYRDFAREISSWSPGVHMFKPIGSIFLSAATMREVWMEYRSPLRFVFFRSWSCPPD